MLKQKSKILYNLFSEKKYRVVDPSILLIGQAEVRQGLFLYELDICSKYIKFSVEDGKRRLK